MLPPTVSLPATFTSPLGRTVKAGVEKVVPPTAVEGVISKPDKVLCWPISQL
jgi:hypothetical protein